MRFDKYEKKGAYHYDWYKTEEWYRKCVDRCVQFCQGYTLDVGGGDGLVAEKISERGYEAMVLDNNPTALGLFHSLTEGRGEWLNCDLDDPNSIDQIISWAEEWDYVACLNTLEHLTNYQTLKGLVDGAKKGAIIITDMPQENPSQYHLKELYPFELASLFRKYEVTPFQIDADFHGIEIHK